MLKKGIAFLTVILVTLTMHFYTKNQAKNFLKIIRNILLPYGLTMFFAEGFLRKNFLYFGYGSSLIISILLLVFLLGTISFGSKMKYFHNKNYLVNHRILDGRGYGYLLVFFATEFLFLLFITKGFIDSYFFHRYTFEQFMNHKGSLF